MSTTASLKATHVSRPARSNARGTATKGIMKGVMDGLQSRSPEFLTCGMCKTSILWDVRLLGQFQSVKLEIVCRCGNPVVIVFGQHNDRGPIPVVDLVDQSEDRKKPDLDKVN